MNSRESPLLYSNNGNESSWSFSLVLHSRYKEKYKKNNESALKSACLRTLKSENFDWINFRELKSREIFAR